MFRTRGLVAAMGALLAMAAGAQVLDPEVTMRPMVLPSPERPATVLELLAIPESGERLVPSEDQGLLTLLTLPETASDVAGQRSAEGLARANENRVTAAERREQALQRASERRGNVVRDAVEARERSTDFNAEVVEAARGIRESLVRGSGVDLPIPISLPGLPEHLPVRPVSRSDGPGLPDRLEKP